MAIWPFNRKKADDAFDESQDLDSQKPSSNLPDEVKEYYETGNKERVGVAWLLGIGTLVITLLLAAGIFFGGRWVYRKVTHKDNTATTAQISDNSDKNKASTNTKSNTNNGSNQNSSSNSGTTTQSNPAPTSPAPQSTTPTPSPSSTPAQTPPSASKTPNTGPGNIFAIAAIAAIAGSIGYYAVQLVREN